MAAPAVDVGYIAASYAVPEATVQSLLSEPTVELVQTLLAHVEAKAREFEELQSEKLRADVENETAVRAGEARIRTLQAAADKAVKEGEQLRQQLVQKETAHQQLETQLQTLQASTSTSSSQVEILEGRIRTLESNNRDTVELLEKKNTDNDRLNEELSAQHQKLLALRKQVSELEDKKQELEAAAKDVTFRENNLRQEIDQLRTNNEWYEGELKTRSADNTRFRKEKNAQIAELQRANADATQTIESLRSKEVAQAKRIEELEQRVEQSLLRIQQLQEEAAQNQQSFRAELDNSRRLAELHQNSANTVKKRLQEVQEQLISDGDRAAEEVGRLQAEIDSERSTCAQYEAKVAQLESVVEEQASQISELQNSAHVPHTPRRALNGGFSTPGRAGSPMISTPGGSKKAALSVTQLYAENVNLKADLRKIDEKYKAQSEHVGEMIEMLENFQPEIDELRQENARMKSEVAEFSSLLEVAISEKETARKDQRKMEGDLLGAQRQNQLDSQIITDLTFQNKLLLLEQRLEEEGLDALSPEEQQLIEETKQTDISRDSRFSSRPLVLYQNIARLVDNNHNYAQQLAKFEQEKNEAQAMAQEQARLHGQLHELQEKAAQYEDEISSLKLRIEAVTKERDMFRRHGATNQRHGRSGSNAQSMFEGTPPPVLSASNNQSQEDVQNSSIFKDLQKSLDILREESITDRATLKRQIDDLTNELRQLQHENVRLTSKQDIAQQWHDQQQHRLAALESQKELLQKRLDAAQDQLANSDLKFQQVMEENIECRGQLENLERANSNLKASQSLWDTTRSRLESEIKTLTETKNFLSKSLEEKRNDYNEQTLMQAENRRLLESRASSLETELASAQRKLQEETEEHRRIAVRFELDATDKQKKIDDLLKVANELRQEVASVTTTRDELQIRVGELQADLRVAEERSQHTSRARRTADNDADEDDLSLEEQLNMQLADLQRDYDRTKEKLEDANTHVENYRNIAQEKEQDLRDFMEAHEQMELEMNRTIQEKEAAMEDLKKRVEDFSSELATTNAELSNLRSTAEKDKLELTQQKDALETELAHIQTEVATRKAELEEQKQLVATQAEIATENRVSYENELAKHGETMKTLRALREQHNRLSTEITQYKTEAEAARASLAQNEEHWTSFKERLDLELKEIRNEKDGLSGQNKTLYEQIDTLNNTIKSLQDNRLSVAGGQTDVINLDSSVSGLQELNKALRNDKDILQLKVNGMELEVQRIRQELAAKQEQLERTNEKLLAEQAHAQNRPNDAKFKALEESVAQLNLYRESNTTLRNDIQRLEAERDQKDKELETLRTQLQPLQARVLELEGDLESSNGILKTVEEDRDRWQKRHQDVLQRYDRIDPKELEDLKQQIETLKTERDQAALQANENVDERIKLAEEETRKAKEEAKDHSDRRQNLVERSRTRINALKTERDELQKSLSIAQSELATMQEELQSTRKERDEALAKVNASADAVMEEEEGQVNETNTGLSDEERTQLESRVKEAEDREKQQANQSVSLGIQLEELKTRERTLEGQIAELQQRIGVLTKEVEDAQNQKARAEAQVAELQSQRIPVQPTDGGPSSDEIEKLKEELAAREKEVEDLRTQADMADSFVGTVDDAGAKPGSESTAGNLAVDKAALEERRANIEEREAALAKAEAELEQRRAAVGTDDASKIKMDNLKKKANEMLRNEKEQARKSIEEKDAEIARKDEEIARLEKEVQQLRTEIEQLKKAPTGTSLPGPDASDAEIRDWISSTPVVKEILRHNLEKMREKEREKERAAMGASSGADQAKIIAQKVKEATANVRAEQQELMAEKIEEAKAAEKQQAEMRFAAKESMLKNKSANIKAKWDVVVQAARETPDKPVKEVYDVANVTKPPPAPPKTEPVAPTPTATPTQPLDTEIAPSQASGEPVQPVSSQPSTATPAVPASGASGQSQPSTAAGPMFQANGSAQSHFGQVPVPNRPNFHNTFQQSMNQGNPFQVPNQMPNQNQFGFSGHSQGGFGALNSFDNNSRPNSPFGQVPQQVPQPMQPMQPYQAPRGNLNLRGPSNIPRGGSNIPLPGGRGRGGPQQPFQANAAAQTSQQQFGRGGGRGGGQGRGRGQQPGSPMNPGAQAFQPGGGRGQKRGADDDGSHRGGKRHRSGGRGGGEGAAAE